MKLSQQGLDLLIDREGIKTHWYFDSKMLPTIGVGHLITAKEHLTGIINISGLNIKWRNGITRDLATELFKQDVAKFEKTVNAHITVSLTQFQYDALVSFCFNIGRNAFFRSTLRRKLNAGDFNGACHEFTRWRKPAAIIGRRAGELAQFKGSLFVARLEQGFAYA